MIRIKLMPNSQRGFSPLILLVFILLASAGLLASTFVFKNYKVSLNKNVSYNNLGEPTHDNPNFKDWLEYVNTDFNFKLKYPPEFKKYGWGSLSTTNASGDTGREICINLDGCLRDKISIFEIRATTTDWSSSRPARFTDVQGYKENGGKYFAIFNSEEFEIPANLTEKIKSSKNVEILIVKGSDGDKVHRSYPEAGWIGALINRDLSTYKGLAIHMKLVDDLNEGLFRKILSTIEFLGDTSFPLDEEILEDPTPGKGMDSLIKYDITTVAKIVNCRFQIDGKYPKVYYPDAKCGTAGTLKNPFTQKPYYYITTNNDKGFVIKAKLSTGEIFTATEITYPPEK